MVQDFNFHGPDPIAVVVPKPSPFVSQMIDEKLSAKKGTMATKGESRVSLMVSGSMISAAVIGPQLPLVKLGVASLNAASMVYFTSLASSGVPS